MSAKKTRLSNVFKSPGVVIPCIVALGGLILLGSDMNQWAGTSFARPILASCLLAAIDVVLFFVALCLIPALSWIVVNIKAVLGISVRRDENDGQEKEAPDEEEPQVEQEAQQESSSLDAVQSDLKKAAPKIAIVLTAAVLGIGFAWYGLTLDRFGLRSMYGTKILYDQYHVKRHFIHGKNVRGKWKYHTVSGYYDFRRTLEKAGFDVHVHEHGRIRPGTLDGFDIYFVGEQSGRGTVMNESERAAIHEFVRNGGGMWATAEHTNVHGVGALYNKMMEGVGVTARFDSICEDDGTEESKDWVTFTDFKKHRVTEGLKEISFFNGCSFETEHGVVFSSDKAWSDKWNPSDPPTHNGDNIQSSDEQTGPLAAIAALNYGKGKLVVTCDHNPFSNPSFHMGSHKELLLNAMNWFAGPKFNRSVYYLGFLALFAVAMLLANARFKVFATWALAAGLGFGLVIGWGMFRAYYAEEHQILFAEISKPSTTARSKEKHAIWSFLQHAQKSNDVELWQKNEILPGYDDLAIVAPTEMLSSKQLLGIDGYLKEGKTVIYVATAASLQSDAGGQLKKHFGFDVELGMNRSSRSRVVRYQLESEAGIQSGIESIKLRRDVPLSNFKGAHYRVVLRGVHKNGSIDLVAEKKMGNGRVVVISPADAFMNRNRSLSKQRLDFVDLIIGIFEWIEST